MARKRYRASYPTRSERLLADKNEQASDGLSLRIQVRHACDEIDVMGKAIADAFNAFLDFGPMDDGRPESDAFGLALVKLRPFIKEIKSKTTL